jgi:histidine triad (HIT) family protein
MVKQLLFKLARSRYSDYFIGFAFEHLAPLLPVAKLYQDRYGLVFFHPVPFWETHLLAVPKKRIPSFGALKLQRLEDQTIILALFRAIQQVAAQQRLNRYTVLVNGGAYQDVPQLHFHLAAGPTKSGDERGRERYAPSLLGATPEKFQTAIAYLHPMPHREVHLIITSTEKIVSFASLNLDQPAHRQALLDILALAQAMVLKYGLTRYTLLANCVIDAPEPQFALHLVSGNRIEVL